MKFLSKRIILCPQQRRIILVVKKKSRIEHEE